MKSFKTFEEEYNNTKAALERWKKTDPKMIPRALTALMQIQKEIVAKQQHIEGKIAEGAANSGEYDRLQTLFNQITSVLGANEPKSKRSSYKISPAAFFANHGIDVTSGGLSSSLASSSTSTSSASASEVTSSSTNVLAH